MNAQVNTLAPVAMFVYNRLSVTRQTIEHLQRNELASQTPLYVFSDGGKFGIILYLNLHACKPKQTTADFADQTPLKADLNDASIGIATTSCSIARKNIFL